MAFKGLAVLALIAICSAKRAQTRWSRQISSYTADISDWVPLPGPVERETLQIRRQAVAEPRILSEPYPGFVKPTGFHQESFPSRGFYNSPANRQLYLQSVPSAPQNYLSEQGFSQGLRFGLSQPNFPLNQGFVGPQFSFDNIPQIKPRPQIQTTAVKFDNSPSQANKPPVKPYISQAKHESPKFVDGYRVENNSNLFDTKKQQSLQKIKFEYSDKSKEAFGTPRTKVEKEEVQLLYVPLESLNRGQFNFRSPLTTAQILNTELYNQRTNPLMQNLAAELQRPAIQQMDTFNSQEFATNFNNKLHKAAPVPKFSTITSPLPTSVPTSKSKKLKPHQPPLAIFSTHDTKNNDQVKVGDVLYSLKNANSVAVLDSVNPLNAPKVFIGPSSLTPPDNYVKFDLPYLSNIENIDKKLRQLPFFVAPLSYNTPQGFAKIPFPSPHVGSVVINSLIKETATTENPAIVDTYSNVYSRPTLYKQEQKLVSQKPVISYYSTSSPAPINSHNYEQNYYSIEPQAISTIRPLKNTEPNLSVDQMTSHKSGSYFLRNHESHYNPSQFVNFPQETNYKKPEPNIFKSETITTPKTTVTTSTKLPSTYPNQLLETHNPYSINQAFHFSTPLDYHNFFDDYKEPYVSSGLNMLPSPPAPEKVSSTPEPTTKLPEPEPPKVTHQPQQSSPNYLQNYSPEIHHETEIHNSRYPVFTTNDDFIKTVPFTQSDYINSEDPRDSDDKSQTVTIDKPSQVYTDFKTQSAIYENLTVQNNYSDSTADEIQATKPTSEYEHYDVGNAQESLSSISSTTTSTRRTPVRTRGRPKYPTVKPDQHEYSTRATITRRPLRERKPLATRTRYETNKVTTETSTKKPFDTSESTTKLTRTRTRGRVHYKPSESDDNYSKRNKPKGKENDLAYQRDILHQNYPVTLMERTSTVDIEAITEPSQKMVSTNNFDSFKTDDAEDAYSNDKPLITEPINSQLKDLPQQYTTAIHSITNAPYTPNNNNDYGYQAKDSVPQHDTVLSYDEIRDSYSIQTTPEQKTETPEILFATKPSVEIETTIPIYSSNDEFETHRQEITGEPEIETNTKIASQELSSEQENVVETTPSYNRVRVRPGVIRQYHQTSSTESTRTDRRRPLQAVTYRPAFDRRRTTMRIEEIEADLKTKQIHVRPEFQDYRQPVYKPEPSTEPSAPSSTTETTTKRGQFRRRRPSYVTTSTEGTVTRRPYDVKNRYRGRRPTEKPADKPEVQTDASSTTVKNNLYSRYSHRPRLSERYNKKSESEDQASEDQDSNYSINRPKYVAADTERWSPKLTVDSFKPFNPNNIEDDTKNEANDNKSKIDQLDIITARNEYEDILISVTPAYNNRVNKKNPEIPPTLEALVEQSKVTKSDSTDTMSTFESMLEEVMKSLEEQDENEYTNNVMKHKGGEIGEIPPERIISSGENYSLKSTTPLQDDATTTLPDDVPSANLTEMSSRKSRRRGFWKKVKVRPVTEGFDVAESQYYPRVLNRLNQYMSKNFVENSGKGNSKVTTYKPNYQFLKDFFENDEETLDVIPNMDIPKIGTGNVESIMKTDFKNYKVPTIKAEIGSVTEKLNPGDMDLGTGSPDPTFDDNAFYTEPTEPTTNDVSKIDRSDGFSFMDYLFGVTSRDKSDNSIRNQTTTSYRDVEPTTEIYKNKVLPIDSDPARIKLTTESSYVPEEITAESMSDNNEYTEPATVLHKINNGKRHLIDNAVVKVESSSMSSYMNPANVISTSMSTEVSHETEICFRGKCIKTNKNIL